LLHYIVLGFATVSGGRGLCAGVVTHEHPLSLLMGRSRAASLDIV
jgi:hypothetical protein